MTTGLPSSFTEIEGWREDFDAAKAQLREVRDSSLFALPDVVCGCSVLPITLKTWSVLDAIESPLVCGGEVTCADALRALWILRADWLGVPEGSRRAKFLRGFRANMTLRACGYDERFIVYAVTQHVESGFMDMPGRFSTGSTPEDPANPSRVNVQILMAGEVMAEFPAWTFEALREIPLAQFWQWLARARKSTNPEYRGDQLTDQVNRRYLGKLNALRRAERAFKNV
jgi:hypothetical protein